jgi:hypothetical protein
MPLDSSISMCAANRTRACLQDKPVHRFTGSSCPEFSAIQTLPASNDPDRAAA